MIQQLTITTHSQGLTEITSNIQQQISICDICEGLCSIFIQHTSASLIIQENADSSAKRDLEHWLNRLVKENDSLYTHTFEGPDDMPAHIKSILTSTSLSIPFIGGRLALGTWQGIYLWEHRHAGGHRKLVMHLSQ